MNSNTRSTTANGTGSWNTKVMSNVEAVRKILDVALCHKVRYINATLGQSLDKAIASEYVRNNNTSRLSDLEKHAGYGFFGFDCIGLIKSVLLWGWNGDLTASYGGATYNDDQDIGEKTMIGLCEDPSTDFSNVIPGEFLYLEETIDNKMHTHCGLYIGNGYAVECTANWNDAGLVVSKVLNIDPKGSGSSYSRSWTKHGKLPFITYYDKTSPGVNLILDRVVYNPSERIDITVKGLNKENYTRATVNLQNINSVEQGRWGYVSNGSTVTIPTQKPDAVEKLAFSTDSKDSNGEFHPLSEGIYKITLYEYDKRGVIAETFFMVSYPRIYDAQFTRLSTTVSGNPRSSGWFDYCITGSLNSNSWVGIYDQNTHAPYSGSSPSVAWHYVSDRLLEVSMKIVAGYVVTRLRIPCNRTNPEQYKVVLFWDSGYKNISERNVYEVQYFQDMPVSSEGWAATPEVHVQSSVKRGEIFPVSFKGVTQKDAWVGVFDAYNDNYREGFGMWCYTATGKQWSISNVSNIVNTGTVKHLSANTLNAYTGEMQPLPTGKYRIVLFQDGGYTKIADQIFNVVWEY